MDQLNNHEYYVARAQSSRALARRAASPAIAAIHEEMASRYESLIAHTAPSATQSYGDGQAA